ncbi:MAG: hypothetical protein CVU08_12730 [Bacteroidetes bacterium HGW-Bacteroidetes-3]|nr:MAG: hypothetical protein CVU08_12730 [Bacteroidetes bacterium HGW-Bacteroidetes-3]
MPFFKKIIYLILVSFLLIQCAKNDQFLIEKGKVGLLTKKTRIKDLNSIFAKDSIVAVLYADKEIDKKLFSVENDDYIIYSKKGKKLLEIEPTNLNDLSSGIKSIQIFDNSYKTAKGISLLSKFKDIKEHYKVNKVETTLTSATLFIDELNATISIDKKELGMTSFSRAEVSIDQIPDLAKIKYFTVWFN